MDSSSDEVAFDYPSAFRIYKNGHIDRFQGTQTVPPSTDPHTGVQSKDVVISTETGVAARLFLSKITHHSQKLPLLIYIHGGAFCVETPFSPLYHNYLTSLTAEANFIAVSVHYRRAPEHPLPIAYDDAWTVIEWAASHAGGAGDESWLNNHADFSRVFFAGDSAGANITHNVAMKASANKLDGVKFVGMVLVQPFFGNNEPDKLWRIICPSSTGFDDPRLNPAADPSLKSLCFNKVLVCVAGIDWFKGRGLAYYEALKKSGWGGVVEIVESPGEDHGFHFFNPSCENALSLLKIVASFMKNQ